MDSIRLSRPLRGFCLTLSLWCGLSCSVASHRVPRLLGVWFLVYRKHIDKTPTVKLFHFYLRRVVPQRSPTENPDAVKTMIGGLVAFDSFRIQVMFACPSHQRKELKEARP